MLLAIDVGNTNTVLGVFDRSSLRDSFRVQTEKDRTGDEYGLQLKSLVDFEKPDRVVGRNTVASMQSGLVFGYVALVDGICARMKEELGFPVKVVATGGLAPLIGSLSKQIEVVDDQLTLDGLRIIYQRNVGDR